MLIHAHARTHAITVELFGESYLFAPHPENKKAFVAEVADEKAIARLLSITEGYVEYGKAPVKAAPVAIAQVDNDGLTEAERELGFKLNDTSDPDGRTPEAIAFERAERERLEQEEADELEAQAERDRALAEAAEREKKEAAEREAAAAAEAERKASFTVKADDGTTVDLTALDDDALRAWAKANGITGINGKAKGDTIRKAIVGAIQAAGAAE